MATEPKERVIVAKHYGRCRLCGDSFAPGTKVLWAPGLGTRCLESDEVDGEDQCVGRFWAPEDNPYDY